MSPEGKDERERFHHPAPRVGFNPPMAQEDAPDLIEDARAQLERAEEASDEARLELLGRLYEALERDLDQASASGR